MPDQAKQPSGISFTLACRLCTDGQIALVLQLFQGDRRALSTTLTIVERDAVSGALKVCRAHLATLGIPERRPALVPAALLEASTDVRGTGLKDVQPFSPPAGLQ